MANINLTIADRRNAWVMDEMLFFREFLGIGRCTCDNGRACYIDEIQHDIIHSFCDHVRAKMKLGFGIVLNELERELAKKRGSSVQSGKGPGKTFMASLIAIWFLVCFNDARVVILGPRYDQVKAQIWAEIGKWLSHSEKVDGANCLAKQVLEPYGDRIVMRQIDSFSKGKRWYARIMTFPKNSSIDDQRASVQGEHERNMLFILDEASGIPDHIFESVDETCTEPNNSIFAIFNPNKNIGWAIETQTKMRDRWIAKHINSENSPRVKKEQIEYAEKKYGRDSNKFRISVLGLAPLQEEGSLIPWDWIQYGKELWQQIEDNPEMQNKEDPIIFGVDIGGGGDLSMVCIRQGNIVLKFESNSSSDTNIVGSWVQRLALDWNPDIIVGDGNGIGNKVFADLSALRIWKVVSLVSQQSATDRKCDRMRDQLYWKLRTLFEERLLAIPDDDDLEGELSLLKYDDEGGQGKIKIISKKDANFKKEMLSRLSYKSPNKADALSLTCHYDERILRLQKAKKAEKRSTIVEDSASSYAWMSR